MRVSIVQGHTLPLNASPVDAVVVIDVIRAFTVAHVAMSRGTSEIFLVKEVESALAFREKMADVLLAGEVQGLPIPGFDLGNSPVQMLSSELSGKRLVMRTTNGVVAALNALDAAPKYCLVSALINAVPTAQFLKANLSDDSHVIIVASHPRSDEDIACAEFLKGELLGSGGISWEEAVRRVKASEAAQKFFDPARPEFDARDIDVCVEKHNDDFAMMVQPGEYPTIKRISCQQVLATN